MQVILVDGRVFVTPVVRNILAQSEVVVLNFLHLSGELFHQDRVVGQVLHELPSTLTVEGLLSVSTLGAHLELDPTAFFLVLLELFPVPESLTGVPELE